jgi:hypothetical protein
MNVDLYKAGHHGSDTSSLPLFMNDVQPSVVIISNGSHKGFKHPRQVTLNTYHALKPTPPVVFQINKCLHPLPCGNEPNVSIADPESSDEDGTIAVTVDAATNSYTVAFGSTTRPFTIKNPAAPVVTVSTGIVITSLLPNPVGSDDQLEEVTIENKGMTTASLVGWTLRDRSGATWNLSGSIAASAARTFRRNGQAMNLNNAGDEIALLDNAGNASDRFGYASSVEGTRIVTGH